MLIVPRTCMASVSVARLFVGRLKKVLEIAICESVKPNLLHFCNGSLLSCFVVLVLFRSVLRRRWPLLVTCKMWPRGGWQLKSFRWRGRIPPDYSPLTKGWSQIWTKQAKKLTFYDFRSYFDSSAGPNAWSCIAMVMNSRRWQEW